MGVLVVDVVDDALVVEVAHHRLVEVLPRGGGDFAVERPLHHRQFKLKHKTHHTASRLISQLSNG